MSDFDHKVNPMPQRATGRRAPLRSEVHPRLHLNWAAIATVLFTAFLFLLIGMLIGASLVMGAVEQAMQAPVSGLPLVDHR